MRPLTDSTPKPLLKIGKYSLIEYHLFSLAKSGFKEIVINISYHPQQFVETLGDGSQYGLKIHYSFEPEDGGLETGGGIFQALSLLGKNPFLAISADLWTDFTFHQLPKSLSGLAHIVLVDNPDHHPEGDFCLKEGKVIVDGKNKLNFGGIGIYHPQLFANCKPGKFPLAPLLTQAMSQGLVTGEHFQGTWLNLGTILQLKNLRCRVD
jgi:MurNAc alpha-1-phosphate uridylyltransferase